MHGSNDLLQVMRDILTRYVMILHLKAATHNITCYRHYIKNQNHIVHRSLWRTAIVFVQYKSSKHKFNMIF